MGFEIVLLLFSAAALLFSIISIIRGRQTKTWPSSTGRITSTSLRKSYDNEGDPDGFYPEIHFTYSVEGETYDNSFRKPKISHRRKAEEYLRQFIAGDQISFFYNPAKPTDITDKQGIRLTAVMSLIISVLIFLYSALKLIKVI